MSGTLTQAEARQHKLQAQRGNMRSLEIILEHLLGGDIILDNLEVTALTADAIAGGDSSLGITGEAAAQGGAIAITGGTSSTAGNDGGNITVVGGAAGVETTGTAGDGGDLGLTGADGGLASAAAGVGGIGGAITLTGGTGGKADFVTTGGLGGVGGEIALGDVGGRGANVTITAGTGGEATATGDNGGIAGDIILTAGAGGATADATVGKSGAIILRPGGTSATPLQPLMRTMAVPSGDAAGAATLTVAEMFGGVHVNDPGGAAAITTPTGVQITDAIGLVADGGSLVVGDSFDFTLMNTGTTGQIQTLTAGDGNVTFIGNVTVDPGVAAEGGGSGMWRFRYTSADAWVGYRIA
jgi:hypothetical protein